MTTDAAVTGNVEVPWADSPDREIIFLIEASTRVEESILRQWIGRHSPQADVDSPHRIVRLPKRSAGPAISTTELGRVLEASTIAGTDPLLAPLRVLWQPRRRADVRRAGLLDLMMLNNPRDPGVLHQMWNARVHPDTYRVIPAEPASASELRDRWRHSVGASDIELSGFDDFVVRQAVLALERAERQIIGARYKIPRMVREEITHRGAFRRGVGRLARELGRPEPSVRDEANRDLKEIAAGTTRLAVDVQAWFNRSIYRHAYGEEPHYDASALDRIAELERRYPIVYLPSHRSYIDTFFLRAALHDHGLPPNHVAAGANLNFFPIGPLYRRAGFFFIRRSFRDDHVYKFVLDEYISYLVGKRFPLEWYIEGGRSRQGKLLPPKFGLLNMVVDAYLAGHSDDVYIAPVSIVYDQMGEVSSYAREAAGGAKKAEGIGFLFKYIRSFFKGSFGEVTIGFGEPVSMREMLGPPSAAGGETHSDRHRELQKLAFEVMVRINAVTPVTATSLVTLAMLGRGDRALTADQIVERLHDYLTFVEKRRIPTTGDLELSTPDGVRRVLGALMEHNVVTKFDGGPDTVYEIGDDQYIQAAYYRNSVIHFFLNSAIVEIALLKVAETPGMSDPVEVFWTECLALRDLLKFEFFFEDKDRYRAGIEAEIELHDPLWQETLGQGREAIGRLLDQFRPYSAHTVLRSFVEAYEIVADGLERRSPTTQLDERTFLASCLALGRQYLLQKRIKNRESLSMLLFSNALNLARNRGLVDLDAAIDGEDLRVRREEFAAEIRDASRRIQQISVAAAARAVDFQI